MTWDKEAVKNLRKSLGLTQTELSNLLGCRQQTISEWEQGLYAPANAYSKLLSQLQSRTPGAFQNQRTLISENIPKLLAEFDSPAAPDDDIRPFDPAID